MNLFQKFISLFNRKDATAIEKHQVAPMKFPGESWVPKVRRHVSRPAIQGPRHTESRACIKARRQGSRWMHKIPACRPCYG